MHKLGNKKVYVTRKGTLSSESILLVTQFNCIATLFYHSCFSFATVFEKIFIRSRGFFVLLGYLLILNNAIKITPKFPPTKKPIAKPHQNISMPPVFCIIYHYCVANTPLSKAPLCKGGSRGTGGGLCIFILALQSLSQLRCQLPLHKGDYFLLCFRSLCVKGDFFEK